MAFQRAQVATLLRRLAEPPHHIIAVFGPRQTGKTMLVEQALRQVQRPTRHLRLDEVDSESSSAFASSEPALRLPNRPPDTEWLVNAWNAARGEADRHPQGLVLALDEIQVLPDWSATVKGLWDRDRAEGRNMHVVILGSAPLLVQSGLRESLAGRFEPIHVTHWTFDEMADAFSFNLAEYIYFGGYPGGARFIREEDRWRNYVLGALVQPNIDKDIVAMTRVDKPALLKQLFELGADYSGRILPYNKMLGQLRDAGNTTTLARYLDLLSTAGLLAGLPKYVPSQHRVRATSPKLNVLNTALMTAGSGYTFAQAQADQTFWGRLVESAIGAHLLNTMPNNARAYYWQDRALEVDFVLRQGPRTVAFEVKSSARTRPMPGLEAFVQRYNPHRAMVVGQDDTPLDEFLSVPVDRWFDDA